MGRVEPALPPPPAHTDASASLLALHELDAGRLLTDHCRSRVRGTVLSGSAPGTDRRPSAVVGEDGLGAGLHLLVHATACGGWVLLHGFGGRGARPEPLASRGVGPSAEAHVAQAVAARLLALRGIEVTGWTEVPRTDDGDVPRTRFRARTAWGDRAASRRGATRVDVSRTHACRDGARGGPS